MKRLAKETAEDSNLKEGEWILVFDNVNFQKKVRHERKQRHTESWDFTSRLAVKASRLPPPELIAETDEPQGSRGKLQPESLLPSNEDEEVFMDRAQFTVMQILTNFLDSFRHLKLFITDKRLDYQAKKTEIHPLALMDINESFIDSNIDICYDLPKTLV